MRSVDRKLRESNLVDSAIILVACTLFSVLLALAVIAATVLTWLG